MVILLSDGHASSLDIVTPSDNNSFMVFSWVSNIMLGEVDGVMVSWYLTSPLSNSRIRKQHLQHLIYKDFWHLSLWFSFVVIFGGEAVTTSRLHVMLSRPWDIMRREEVAMGHLVLCFSFQKTRPLDIL